MALESNTRWPGSRLRPIARFALRRGRLDQPFELFRIKRVNNTTYDITEPRMVTIGERVRS